MWAPPPCMTTRGSVSHTVGRDLEGCAVRWSSSSPQASVGPSEPHLAQEHKWGTCCRRNPSPHPLALDTESVSHQLVEEIKAQRGIGSCPRSQTIGV